MHRRVCVLLLLSCLLLWPAARGATLRVGVLPYLSPRSLLIEFAPLQAFLQRELHDTVELQTAPDLPRFLVRTANGDFDLIISAPHFARLAQQEQGFAPLIAIRADFYALLLVHKDSPAQTLRDLRGTTLHLPHRLAFVSFQVEDFLRQRGFEFAKDLTPYYYSTDSNAILALDLHPGSAAAAQRSVFERMPQEITSRLRIIGSTQSALSLIIAAHPRLDAPALMRLQTALEKFPYSEQGLKFFEASHTEFIPVDTAAMRQLDPALARLHSRLAEKR